MSVGHIESKKEYSVQENELENAVCTMMAILFW